MSIGSISVQDFVAKERTLEEEARELMPWEPKKCTYELGPLRQQVFACRTHNEIGVCYSCSIICHTSCDIVELFTKRNFTCDCGTERDNRIGLDDDDDLPRCEIRKNTVPDIPASDNVYNHNFKGLFCDCATEYDPDSKAVMLQCVMGLECDEDWYHDYCIMGRDDKASGDLKDEGSSETTNEMGERILEGFPDLESFDSYICWKCVKKYEYYFSRLLSHNLSDKLFASKLSHESTENEETTTQTGSKRRSMDSDLVNDYSLFLDSNYSKTLNEIKLSIEDKKDKLYIFLDQLVPFLIKDEEIYEPNDDDEKEINIFELTKNLLQNSMHREDAVSSIVAFQTLKSKLNTFLKPFADKGEIVKEEDIKAFFGESSK